MVKIRKKGSILFKINLCSLFAGMILSMNGIRYLLDIQESNFLIYGIYVIFIAFGIMKYSNKIKSPYPISTGVLFIICTMTLFYCILTSIWGGTNAIIDAIKLTISVMVAYIVSLMNSKDIRYTIDTMYVIIVSYVVIVLLKPEKIDPYIIKGSNYLVLSLPIGLVLSMMLIRIILHFYNKINLVYMIPDIIASILCFVGLTKFSGRGSILFPFLIAILFVLFLGKKYFFKMIPIMIILIMAVIIAYRFFIKNADPYIVNRFLRMFNENSSEDRWEIWRGYIDYALSNQWFLVGGGTGSAVREYYFYPHNLYLHLAGEFGIIGIITSMCFTFCTISKEVWGFRSISIRDNKNSLIFYELCAGTIYMFLNFMKSFSLYDCCPLLIFIMALVTFTNNLKVEYSNGKLLS